MVVMGLNWRLVQQQQQKVKKKKKIMNDVSNLQDYLYTSVKRRDWEEVIKKCEEETEGLSIKLTQGKETVLHLAIYDNQLQVVTKLVQVICKSSQKEEIIKAKNERKNTPLHVAAVMGCARMCQIIGSVDEQLVNERNIDGETPLFLAALYGHKMAFYCLYNFCKTDLNQVLMNSRKNNGDTILHSALQMEKFDLAFQLINMNNEAATWVDKEGNTPLHVLATKPSAFKSGAHINKLQSIVYYFIHVKELKRDSAATRDQAEKPTKEMRAASYFPRNYATIIAFFTYLFHGFTMVINWKPALFKKKEEVKNPCDYVEAKATATDLEEHESDPPLDTQLLKTPYDYKKPSSSILPPNYDTCLKFLEFFFSAIMIILGFGFGKIRKLRENKQKHTWSVQVMERLLELDPPDKYGQRGDIPILSHFQTEDTLPYNVQGDSIDFHKNNFANYSTIDPNHPVNFIAKETAMLSAAMNGVVEIVSRIFQHFPLAVCYSNRRKKNVVLLAAEYCQPDVYNFFLNKRIQLQSLFQAVDNNGNSALHLAAQLQTQKTWHITGAAFQMLWEVKWYEYVRDSVEPHFFAEYNNEGKLAENIFNERHENLVKDGSKWLSSTSESCSVVAALVVTVAYASATTVPGGNGDKGLSPFENDTGFFIFSITSLLALCLSTTSVIMFLAILTSRFDENDFGSKLPLKLLTGLSSLFLSIVAMMVSFCAGHYFLLSHYLQNMAVVIYIATSVPVLLIFVEMQLPLYYDLLNAILSKTPRRSHEVIAVD